MRPSVRKQPKYSEKDSVSLTTRPDLYVSPFQNLNFVHLSARILTVCPQLGCRLQRSLRWPYRFGEVREAYDLIQIILLVVSAVVAKVIAHIKIVEPSNFNVHNDSTCIFCMIT